jgi:hypothetical protein
MGMNLQIGNEFARPVTLDAYAFPPDDADGFTAPDIEGSVAEGVELPGGNFGHRISPPLPFPLVQTVAQIFL